MLAILLYFGGAFSFVSADQPDVCSQVFLMSQYCSSQGVNDTGSGFAAGVDQSASYAMLEEKMNVKFRELESRLIREFGEPPEVNYTAVEETIKQRFRGVERRIIQRLGSPPEVNYTAIDISIEERFKRLEARVNGDGDEEGIVNYQRIDENIAARYRVMQAYIDTKFATLLNDTEDYEKAVEEMKRRKEVSDCRDIRLEDAKLCNATGGVFDIYRGNKKYEVFCDTYTDHGGWTVFQRRMDGTTNFNRTYEEYVDGFGDRSGEFWLGLKNVHELLQGGTHELRVDLMDSAGRVRFAKYGLFYVAGKSRGYQILLNTYSGDASDSLGNHHGRPFSNFDLDRDTQHYVNCAIERDRWGGWWFSNCGPSSLNGVYTNGRAFYWTGITQLVRSEMKFRKLEED